MTEETTIAEVELPSEDLTLRLFYDESDPDSQWSVWLDTEVEHTGVCISVNATKELALAHAEVVLREALARVKELKP